MATAYATSDDHAVALFARATQALREVDPAAGGPSSGKMRKSKVKSCGEAVRVVLQLVTAAPGVATVMGEELVGRLEAAVGDRTMPHLLRFMAGWVLRAAGENGALYASPARVLGAPEQAAFHLPLVLAQCARGEGARLAEFVPLLDFSPAGKSLTRALSVAAYVAALTGGLVGGVSGRALQEAFEAAVVPVLAAGLREAAVERKSGSVFSFGSGSGGGGVVEVTELDGSRAMGAATVLSITSKYSHEQLFGALAFSVVARVLRAGGVASSSPALRDAVLGYCMRVLAQVETVGTALFASLSSSGFSLSRTKAAPIDAHVMAAAQVEVIKILDTLAASEPAVLSEVFPIVRRVHSRNLEAPDGFVFLALLEFMLHHAAAVGYDPGPMFSAFFQSFLTTHLADTVLGVATFGFCMRAAGELSSASTPVFATYFPALLQVVAYAPHAVAADVFSLLPHLVTAKHEVELVHALLDLPLCTACLEMRASGVPLARPGYRVLFNHVLRTESGVSINFWESTTTAELMASFCADTRMSPRIHAAAQLAPLLLAAVFDAVLDAPTTDAALAGELFSVALARFEQLFLLDLYTVAVRRVVVHKVVALLDKWPTLVASHRDEIVAYLAGGVTPGTLELHTALTWAIGQFAAVETDPVFTAEVLDDLHSTLQVMVFEHIASAAQGRDALAAAGIEPLVLNRLMYMLVSSLAKLAARYQTLTPSVTLCLTKLLNRAADFDPYVVAAASHHVRLLQFPGMAAALLAAPRQPGLVDRNSSLPFVLAAHSLHTATPAIDVELHQFQSGGSAQ